MNPHFPYEMPFYFGPHFQTRPTKKTRWIGVLDLNGQRLDFRKKNRDFNSQTSGDVTMRWRISTGFKVGPSWNFTSWRSRRFLGELSTLKLQTLLQEWWFARLSVLHIAWIRLPRHESLGLVLIVLAQIQINYSSDVPWHLDNHPCCEARTALVCGMISSWQGFFWIFRRQKAIGECQFWLKFWRFRHSQSNICEGSESWVMMVLKEASFPES